jgi:ABC-2 type transport system permease protein
MAPMGDRKIKKLGKLIKIWLILASREAQVQFLTNWAGILFIVGKVLRFSLFFVFIFSILSSTKSLVGYTREQVIFFFLVFNLVDILIQFLYRGIYTFRFRVVSGDYDIDLVKPWPSFFRPVFGSADFLDFLTLIPLWAYFFWFISRYQLLSGSAGFLLFLLLLVNSLVVGFAFHLFVCAVCVITLKIDHLVWVYRDLTNMARFPTDIYQKGIQYLLTFTIPVVILITVPAKALLGLLSWQWIGLSFLIGGVSLWASLRFWCFALSRYSSASS